MYTTIKDMLVDPDTMINAPMRLKEERAARAKAEAEVEAQRPVAAIDKAGKIRPQLLVTPAGQTYFAGILSA